jgi:hypothetical protein
MSKFNYWLAVSLTLSLFVIVGCASQPAPTPISQTGEPDPPDLAEDYPGPELQITTREAQPGYPALGPLMPDMEDTLPQPELPLQLNPSEIGATIGGVILDRVTRQGPLESLIYLGQVQYTETGFPVVSLNRQEAPVTILSRNGVFIFEDIEPGEYAVILFTPDYSLLVEYEDGISVTFTAADGDVIDLGTIIVDIP